MAAFGIVGLETAVGLMLTHLVDKKILSLNQLIEKMSIHPRRILQLPDNMIKDGEMANFTIIDPDLAWTVDRGRFLSKSKNLTPTISPFNNKHTFLAQ